MISLSKAKIIARKAAVPDVERIRAMGLEVSELDYARENDYVWTFAAAIPQLQEEGVVPGAIMISIDKRDGHVWTDEDFARIG